MANNVIKRVWNQNRMVNIDYLGGFAFCAEDGGHTFQISGVDDSGNAVALSGSVAGVFLRPDNTDVAITGSASGGVVSITLPANCYDVPGRFGLTIFVTANGQKTAVYAAMGTVSRTSSGTVAPGTTADVVDLINRINAAVATIPASWTGLMADIAPTYSDAAVYPVGAYCYYNGDLYRCTTAITTAESWTAGHWTQAVLGNDVSDLKSAFDDLESAVSVEKTGEYETVQTSWIAGYINNEGGSNSSASYQHNAQIDVSDGDTIRLYKQSDGTEINTVTYATAYVNNSAVSNLGGYNYAMPYIVPPTVTKVVFSLSASLGTIVVKKASVYLENSESENVALLKSKTLGTDNETNTENVTWSSGYVAKNGTISSSSSYKYSNKIAVEPGDVIDFYSSNGSTHISTARFATIYKNNTAVESLGSEEASFPYTVPDGADEVIFTIAASLNNIVCYHTTTVIVNSEKPRVDALYNALINKNPNKFSANFDVAANGSYTMHKELQDLCGYRICFFAKIGTFAGKTMIGKAETQTYGGAIAFDGTNLYSYISGNTTTASRTQAHGLTLTDYVGLIIDYHYKGNATVILSTNGGSYTWDLAYWRSQYGEIKVSSESALSDCELSYMCEGVFKDIWLYGDSYFANTGTIRWTAYLVRNEYTNYLLNGYPGRNSATALASLRTDLELNRTPKKIIWCLGMNDADGESTPNASWQDCVEKVMDICERNEIELILATIPNVSTTGYKNTEKNAYVVASGYRYIDFANAISADGSSTWYDGMLDDGIHPTEQGALCLFNCAVSAVPELLQ